MLPKVKVQAMLDVPVLNVCVEFSKNTVILGPSGSGKSTLLRVLCGFYDDTASIFVDDQIVKGVGPKRGFSIAWQDVRLIPNLTVKENIGVAGPITNEVLALCADFRMSDLLDRYPHQISGGEAQRVNILRACCSPARVVLLDEPMQGIDPVVARKILKQLLYYMKRAGKLVILVTHELYQVYGLFDQALALRSGVVVDHRDLRSMYDKPISPWLANFLGNYVVLNKADLRNFIFHSNEDSCMVRPEWFKVKKSPLRQPCELNATVTGVQWHGSSTKVSVVLDGTKKPLTVETYTELQFTNGERVYVNFKKSTRPDWVCADRDGPPRGVVVPMRQGSGAQPRHRPH